MPVLFGVVEVRMWYAVAGGASPAAPTLHPDAGGLPGAATLQRLADGIGGWALIAAMMGIVVGAVIWAFGRQTTRRKFLVGCSACGYRPLLAGRGWPLTPGRRMRWTRRVCHRQEDDEPAG